MHVEILSPESISAAFCDHIVDKRMNVNHVGLPQPFANADVLVRDFCIDQFHLNQFARKEMDLGDIVAGSSVRRVSYNDVGLQSPYELMQEAVQQRNPKKPITVVVSPHAFCGELFLQGAVTPEAQAAEQERAVMSYRRALAAMRRNASADAKRIRLEVKVGQKGSAPVIVYSRTKGRIEIANPLYIEKVADEFPLNPEALDRLVAHQRVLFKRDDRSYYKE